MKKRSCIIAFGIVALSAACFAGDGAGPLREMIVRNAGALRGKSIWVDMFGQPMRASFAGADAAGMTVELMGQTVVLPWERVSPRRLIRMALKAASSAADYAAAARFAHAEGLDEDAHRILDVAAEKRPDAADETAALRQELFPEAPPPSVEERPAPKPSPGPAAEPVPSATSQVEPSVVPTFHCLGVYWSPEKGEAGRKVLVTYRESGQKKWRGGLPMRHNPVDSPECKGDYRGSIVNLRPGTVYEVALALEGTEIRTAFRAATWSENFPIASVSKRQSSTSTLSVSTSGRPDGYVLFDGTGSVIDTENKSDHGITVNGSYIIIRGFTIRNVKKHGIRIMNGHHIVIENCDISKWGTHDKGGWGQGYQAGVFCNNKALRAVVVQRCKIHHPSWDSNSWAEKNNTYHPDGPQTVVFWDTEGNHVIRYNELWSDEDHYFNDVLGAAYNSGFRGFPGADSDIYCNYVASCWDDGIEAEGGNQNVRIWSNYIENTMMPMANAATSVGPLYVWRNVSGRSYSPPGSQWNLTHGYLFKMGYAGSEKWMTGHMYIFNNTIFQPNGEGAGGLGGGSKLIKHCVTRNNILHARDSDSRSISTNKDSVDNDFDYDLLSARYPAGHEKHGASGKPRYVPGAGFSFETKTGNFQLAPGSRGYDAGAVIPNFCDVFTGNGPDVGAHEAGTGPMRFGVKAEFVPPGATPRGPEEAAP